MFLQFKLCLLTAATLSSKHHTRGAYMYTDQISMCYWLDRAGLRSSETLFTGVVLLHPSMH